MGSANRAEMLAPQCCSRKTVALRRRPGTPKALEARLGAPVWGTERGLRGVLRTGGISQASIAGVTQICQAPAKTPPPDNQGLR